MQKPGTISGNRLFIFDLDGTLYRFEEGGFSKSKFYADIKVNAYKFLSERLNLPLSESEKEYQIIKEKYKGEISLGVEKEFGIERYVYFANTWNLNPEVYFPKNPSLPNLFRRLKGRVAILTSAPRIWAKRTLDYLEISPFINDALFTGEPNIRKPSPLAFQQVIDYFGTSPERAISIGDQEATDILPAKSLGMKTVIIGKESGATDFCIESLEELIKLIEGGIL